jgi:hypothetical protein
MSRVLRLSAFGLAVQLALAQPSAQSAASLEEVLARLTTYLDTYEQQLSSVSATEEYVQEYQYQLAPGTPALTNKRRLTSDFVFLRLPGGEAWLGFRDTILVDGKPVRDRDSRLLQSLSTGGGGALDEAARLTAANTRYNLGSVPRTINVPTQTLDLLHPRHRNRFECRKAGDDSIDRRRVWRLECREVTRPSIVKTREGADQLSRVTVSVDPNTGAVLKTVLDLGGDRAVDFVQTKITVSYSLDAGLGLLVPVELIENYYRPADGQGTAMHLNAVGRYTGFRQFHTSGRLVTDR